MTGATTASPETREAEVGAARLGRAGLVGIAAAVATFWTVGLLGPSVVQPPLGSRTLLPPWDIGAEPGAWLTAGLVAGALVVGATGLGAGWLALRTGWSPDPRRLLAAGVLAVAALVLVPPMGSADHLSYAAYGRIAVAGDDPYVEVIRALGMARITEPRPSPSTLRAQARRIKSDDQRRRALLAVAVFEGELVVSANGDVVHLLAKAYREAR